MASKLCSHATIRDKYGLPVPLRVEQYSPEDREWQSDHRHLVVLFNDVKHGLVLQRFLENMFDPSSDRILIHEAPKRGHHESSVQGVETVGEELGFLEEVLEGLGAWYSKFDADCELRLNQFLERPLNPFDEFCPSPPRDLYRVSHSASHTRDMAGFGLLASNWSKCIPASSWSELIDRGLLTSQDVQGHCDEDGTPSKLISLTNRPDWTLMRLNKEVQQGKSNVKVTIINGAKLDRLHKLWARSDDLVKWVGGRPWRPIDTDGIHFVSDRHFLVYGWIPSHCIGAVLDADRFRARCCNEDIVEYGSIPSS